MRPLIVLGCTSDAGKSLVATALCRWFARQGVSVVPYKAQNMSNNARVVGGVGGIDGAGGSPFGEIGVAQWLQARAAGVEPDVRMNPVLVKPEADTRSQVIVLGQVDHELGALPWVERHDALWEPMRDSLDALRRESDLVVIEGAGSPAEINLRDQVNNRVVEYADARALLVSDIDRGGSFAHLYGTWALVPDSTRQRLEGFLLNKFRGDAALLAPGPEILTAKTGMGHVGTLPMMAHDLPREEGATELHHGGLGVATDIPIGIPTVVIPRLPYGSNLDEFHLLAEAADVRWVTSPAQFEGLRTARDVIVLPGSKHVASDLGWMRARGIDRAVTDAVERGVRVVGVCGGAMMLGRSIDDPSGIEGVEHTDGLGLLDVVTHMGADKTVRRGRVTFGISNDHLADRWTPLDGITCDGYEIRHGVVTDGDDRERDVWSSGGVLATTWHGLFEDPAFVRALLGVELRSSLDATFDLLADAIDEHLDTAWLRTFLPGEKS